jgi:DNA-binding LacI/PurR family transcriptional regulator
MQPDAAARMNHLLQTPSLRPSAIFASRIEHYATLEPLLKANGLRVPEDLSVIACGGTSRLPGMEREVDSFIIDFSELGRKAFQRLLETVQGRLRETHTLVECPLKRFGSTAKAVQAMSPPSIGA